MSVYGLKCPVFEWSDHLKSQMYEFQVFGIQMVTVSLRCFLWSSVVPLELQFTYCQMSIDVKSLKICDEKGFKCQPFIINER